MSFSVVFCCNDKQPTASSRAPGKEPPDSLFYLFGAMEADNLKKLAPWTKPVTILLPVARIDGSVYIPNTAGLFSGVYFSLLCASHNWCNRTAARQMMLELTCLYTSNHHFCWFPRPTGDTFHLPQAPQPPHFRKRAWIIILKSVDLSYRTDELPKSTQDLTHFVFTPLSENVISTVDKKWIFRAFSCLTAFSLIILTSLHQGPTGDWKPKIRKYFTSKGSLQRFSEKCSLCVTLKKRMNLSRIKFRLVFCVIPEEVQMSNCMCKWMTNQWDKKKNTKRYIEQDKKRQWNGRV